MPRLKCFKCSKETPFTEEEARELFKHEIYICPRCKEWEDEP